MHYKNLRLDKFQAEAIQSIENNHSVVVSAPTDSGKTLIAYYNIKKDIKKGNLITDEDSIIIEGANIESVTVRSPMM